MTTFTETQKNPFRWYLLAFCILGPVLLWRFSNFFDHFGDQLWVSVLLFSCFYCLLSVWVVYVTGFKTLLIHLDQQGVQYRMKPFGKLVKIGWEEIEQTYVRDLVVDNTEKFAIIRHAPDELVYIMKGTYGLQINKKSGVNIFLGTQRPTEMQTFLNKRAVSITM